VAQKQNPGLLQYQEKGDEGRDTEMRRRNNREEEERRETGSFLRS
jgi:hypothetical protein